MAHTTRTNLFATTCPGCDRRGSAPCATCIDTLMPLGAIVAPPGVDRAWALLQYTPVARSLITALKIRNNRSTLPWFALALANLAHHELAHLPTAPTVCTWAPTTRARRRHRGFDHAELLARAVADHLGMGCLPLLRRLDREHQTGHSRAERLAAGPHMRVGQHIDGHVVVIDDITTTGATLTAAAKALRAAGAQQISAFALAHPQR